MWNKLGAIFSDVFSAALNWFYVAYKAGAAPDFYWLWFCFIVFAVWLASGFLAATIAEMRSHKMKLHFCMGLALPYVYPFLLLSRLKKLEQVEKVEELELEVGQSYHLTAKLKDKIAEKEAAKQAKTDARRRMKGQHENEAGGAAGTEFAAATENGADAPPDAVPAQETAAEPVAPVMPAAAQFTRGHFESIAVDNAGNRAGPFSVSLKGGAALTAEAIKSVQDDLVIFEMLNKNGETKNIRVKFANIESCERMN